MATGESIRSQPAGWYQDPAPRNPAVPDTVRYWDGTRWTAQTRLATRRQRQEWAAGAVAERLAYEQQLVERAQAGDTEARQVLAAAALANGSRSATPDGARLAGWWIRLAAQFIDGVAVTLLGAVFAWRFLSQISSAYSTFFDDAMHAAQTGGPQPDPAILADQVATPMMWSALVFALVACVYEVAFLKAFQATPGKLMLGLQVRLRETPGPLTWGTVLLRWVGKSGVGLLQLIPFGVALCALYSFLDYLWPLWDAKRQALHDKLAGTNVVHRRG